MASMSNLLISWNFDTVTGSNGSGQITVADTSNGYSGLGISFQATSSNFIAKEDIKTNRKLKLDVLESSETIQILEEDDKRIDSLNKPSSMQLLLENSMYQVISDEMMNMFSTIDAFTFKFVEPYNKYRDSYNKLDAARYEFFSKVVEKPNLEKYVEFYKWIDSSLNYMIQQLLPESVNNSTGLKNTIESHVLERNKFQHNLPLSVEKDKNYSSGIVVTSNKSLNKSAALQQASGIVENIVNTLNSDAKKDLAGVYPVYELNNFRNQTEKDQITAQLSSGSGIQGCTSSAECGSFRDNGYVQRNIPWTSGNYANLNEVNYQNIPSEEVEFRHYTNLLIDVNKNTYLDSKDIVEPPIQQNVPLKQNLKLNAAFENIDIYSPYSAQIDLFSYRNLYKQDSILTKQISGGYYPISSEETVYNKIINNENQFKFNRFEKLEVIFPRTDLIGLAEIRTKSPSYDEEVGSFQNDSLNTLDLLSYDTNKLNYWTDNSYNNNSGKIRSFWRDSLNNRKRTTAQEANNLLDRPETGSLGSFNNLGFPNRINNPYTTSGIAGASGKVFKYKHIRDIYNSKYSMDCNVQYDISGSWFNSNTILTHITCSNEIYGDLGPYSHFNLFYLTNVFENDNIVKIQPKCFFTHNIYVNATDPQLSNKGNVLSVLNKSYQTGLDCRIKPWYDSYEEFRSNIKHKSQTHSIVPEFITSRYEEVIKKQFVELYELKTVSTRGPTGITADGNTIEGASIETSVAIPRYLTINGGERYDQIRQQNFKVDLKQFIDKKSNKIKFKLNAIKKLLPYNGFYPQQRTTQIASIFSDNYLSDTNYVTDEQKINIKQNGINTSGYESNTATSRVMATIQPLFAPGILFNTIKAGIALPWHTYVAEGLSFGVSDMYKDEYSWPNFIFENKISGKNEWFVSDVNRKLPFETILDPYKFYQNVLYYKKIYYRNMHFDLSDIPTPNLDDQYLPYLDPTHHSDLIKIPAAAANGKYTRKVSILTLLEHMRKADSRLYKSAINNFLAESINFFLKGSELTYISSDQKETVEVIAGTEYTMNIVLGKFDTFSMFNSYSDEASGVIPPHSLFGPPVAFLGEGAKISSSLSTVPYMPYAPPYMYEQANKLTLSYTPLQSKSVTLQEIINNTQTTYFRGNNEEDLSEVGSAKRLSVKDIVNWSLISGSSWVIQTKFETPLFNFNNCSLVQTGSLSQSSEYIPA